MLFRSYEEKVGSYVDLDKDSQVADEAEDVVEQEKADARHHADEHVARNVARAKVQVGKGQRQHHHHQAAQGVEHLAPEFDFIALGALAVGLQVADVLKH